MHTLTAPAMPTAGDVDGAHALAASFLEARRLKHGAARMDAGAGDPPAGGPPAGDPPAGKTFTQDDVDRLIGDAKRQATAKFADYDALKAQAQGSKTLEERLAQLDRELASERLARTRATVAARHNLGDLSDVLAGSSEEELEANAKRIADRLKASPATSTSTTRTRTRTASTSSLKEPANPQGLDKKAQAIEALRGLSGRSVVAGD